MDGLTPSKTEVFKLIADGLRSRTNLLIVLDIQLNFTGYLGWNFCNVFCNEPQNFKDFFVFVINEDKSIGIQDTVTFWRVVTNFQSFSGFLLKVFIIL